MSEEQEAPKGRSASEIIEEICSNQGKVLEILNELNDYEHNQMTNAPLLVALQRARGLSCYETLAAYAMSAERESVRDDDFSSYG